MSQETIQAFWKRVADDEGLRAELDGLLTSKQGVPASEIVALGAKHGLVFTSDELQATMTLAAGGELSEEQLEAVAGGALVFPKVELTGVKFLKLEQDAYKLTTTTGFGIINF
jgi:predicted ribosomally synthesized peptide with nif11-like leader